VKQGSPADHFYLIVDGLVEVAQETGDEFKDFDFYFAQQIFKMRKEEDEAK